MPNNCREMPPPLIPNTIKNPWIWHVVLFHHMGLPFLNAVSDGMGRVDNTMQMEAIMSNALMEAMMRWWGVPNLLVDWRMMFKMTKRREWSLWWRLWEMLCMGDRAALFGSLPLCTVHLSRLLARDRFWEDTWGWLGVRHIGGIRIRCRHGGREW